jgi:hypothetical protein
MEYLKIKDSPFVKDAKTKALLNTDRRAVLAHEHRMKTVNKNLTQESKINKLEEDMNDIKTLMQAILQKLSG